MSSLDPVSLEESYATLSADGSDGRNKGNSNKMMPTLYVQNETDNNDDKPNVGDKNHLRFRNRSSDDKKGYGPLMTSPCDSGIDSPSISNSTGNCSLYSSARSSQVEQQDNHVHDGSLYNYGEQTPPVLYAPKKRFRDASPPPFYEAEEDDVKMAEVVSDDLVSILNDLWQKLLGRKSKAERLFRSDAPSISPKLASLLPVLAVIVMLASSVFTVLALRAAVDRAWPSAQLGQANADLYIPNGKYASIEFGSRRRREALKAEGKVLPEDLPEGLGGKKAAIQYAYEMMAKKTEEGKGSEVEDELMDAIKDNLSKKEGDNVEKAAAKARLLEKISQFRDFTTTKVEPIKEKEKEEDGEQETKGKKETEKQDVREADAAKKEPENTKPGKADSAPRHKRVSGDGDLDRSGSNRRSGGSGFRKVSGEHNNAAFAPGPADEDPFRFLPDN